MALQSVFNLSGLNLQTNPLQHTPGDLLRAVNVDFDPDGAMTKRPGVVSFLGTADGSAVNSLFSWTPDGSTAPWLYRASGSALYSSAAGTGAWTLTGNGTITAGGTVRSAVLTNTLILGDGAGSTRHSTSGTSFTNTTLAPVARDFVEYQQRVYAVGTSSTLFYSTTGDASNWNTSGTSDSNSFNIPGAGKLLRAVKLSDRVITHKESGAMHRWDGDSLVDMSTTLGMTSPESFGQIEDYGLFMNRLGVYGADAGAPKLLSRKIQPQIYNDSGSAIAGTTFSNLPAAFHRYDYFASVGTIADDVTNETISNAVIVYDIVHSQFRNYQYAVRPTAFHSYKDANGVQQFIFGDSTGQCYQVAGTATTDNGSAISSYAEGVIHHGTLLDKKWNWFRAAFNPGCQAKVAIAISNTFTKGAKNWKELGDASTGVVEYRFPEGSRGKFLYWKIYDSSKTSRWTLYGMEHDSEIIPR